MQAEEYAKMYHLEDTYWWFQGRKRVVACLLRKVPGFSRGGMRILDLGCGTGLMLEHLSRLHCAVGLDFSPLALEFSRERGAKQLVRADVTALPHDEAGFDIVTALDLAEHVEDEAALLSEIVRVLRPGGHLILTAPAHPFLWSDHDEALYHCRRYTRTTLRDAMHKAGLEIERLTYCITFTFPLIVLFRFLQRLVSKADQPKTHLIALPGWANAFLKSTVDFEAFLLGFMNLPVGVTLVAIARKKSN